MSIVLDTSFSPATRGLVASHWRKVRSTLMANIAESA